MIEKVYYTNGMEKEIKEKHEIKYGIKEDKQNESEIERVLSMLSNTISSMNYCVIELKLRLAPILPLENNVTDGKEEHPNFAKLEQFSCPLARKIEDEYSQLHNLSEYIAYLLENIKI